MPIMYIPTTFEGLVSRIETDPKFSNPKDLRDLAIWYSDDASEAKDRGDKVRGIVLASCAEYCFKASMRYINR